MTSNNSNQEEPKTTRVLINELVEHLAEAQQGFNQHDFRIAIRDGLQQKGLPSDHETVDSIETLVAVKLDPNKGKDRVRHPDSEFKIRKSQLLVPGFLKHRALHVINAEQGTGKSVLALNLYRELCIERTGKFLDLDIDLSRKYKFFLVGVDMPEESWQEPLAKFGAFSSICKAPSDENEVLVKLRPDFMLWPQESAYSLSNEHIEEYRNLALKTTREGFSPFFVFDSYSALVANQKDLDERTPEFAGPLRNLQKAMAGTGATMIVLHHTTKSASSSVANSGAGHGSFGRIPDVAIEISRAGKFSSRLYMTSSKRIQSTSLCLELDYENARWISHGDAKQLLDDRELINKIDGLRGAKEKVYELAQVRWETQKLGFTTKHVENWLEVTPQSARKHVRWLDANNIIFECGKEPTAGKYLPVYLPSEYKAEHDRAAEMRVTEQRNLAGTPKNAPRNPSTPQSGQAKEPLDAETETQAEKPEWKKPEVNVSGEIVPRLRSRVVDNAGRQFVVTMIVSGTEVQVQKFGEANSPLMTKRWLLDVFPTDQAL